MRERFRGVGAPVNDWAQSKSFGRGLAYRVLRGSLKEVRGAQAVAIGRNPSGQAPLGPMPAPAIAAALLAGHALHQPSEGPKK
jgi:hypothetical protein